MNELKLSIVLNVTEKESEKYSSKKPEDVTIALIKFKDQTFKVNVAEELQINENDMMKCMVEHAKIYGFWASLNTTVKQMLRKLKKEAEKLKSSLDGEARESLKADEIKVTEAAVNAWLNCDPRTKKFTEEINSIEDAVEFTDAILRSLEHKRDMLKEINKAQSKEYYQN